MFTQAEGGRKDEDEYGATKIRQVIQSHIFQKVKFIKGEGAMDITSIGKRKNTKRIVYGK